MTSIGPVTTFNLLRKQNGKCIYCRRSFTEVIYPTADHIVPRSKGGKTSDGIVLACKRCNGSRGNIDIDIFLDGYTQGQADPVKVRGPRRWYHGNIIKW